jgi:ABC-type lipoprotein export system ATPase subunit
LLKGDKANAVRSRVTECLEIVGMHDRGRHRPSELSGGEQQRVAIARALVHQPQLILADEPTGNLDSHTGADIVGLLKRLNQQLGQTILLVTHSEAAAHEAGRRYLMRDGELLAGHA